MDFAAFTVLRDGGTQQFQTGIVKKLPPHSKLLRLSLAASLTFFAASSVLASETVIYTYDELGRLVRTSQTGSVNNGVVTDIDYDAAGNRTDYDVTGSNGSGTDDGVTGTPGSGGGETPPAFAVSNGAASEGAPLTFTVNKSAATTNTYTVSWTTANGSALNGSDYTGNSGSLAFTGAQTSKTIVIPTVNDSAFEQTEVFYLNLTAASGGATISDPQGAGTISDNDTPNTPPVANNDVGVVSCSLRNFLVMSNDTDADGDALTLIGASGALNPYVSGNYLYVNGTTNPGTYQINYTIRDIHNATATATLTATWVTEESCPGGNNGGGPEQ